GDRARIADPRDAPGDREASLDTVRRRSRRLGDTWPRGPIPPHPGADAPSGCMDGRNRRGVGRAPRALARALPWLALRARLPAEPSESHDQGSGTPRPHDREILSFEPGADRVGIV